MSDAIRDALRVAGEAAHEAYEFDEDHRGIAAAAVAAFLRALPVDTEIEAAPEHRTEFDALAAAVERAARGEA